MSESANDGGQAFPVAEGGAEGMTLRDYFAGQALAGMSSREVTQRGEHMERAVRAYALADAMLAARVEVQP